jgi:hypothetical protein
VVTPFSVYFGCAIDILHRADAPTSNVNFSHYYYYHYEVIVYKLYGGEMAQDILASRIPWFLIRWCFMALPGNRSAFTGIFDCAGLNKALQPKCRRCIVILAPFPVGAMVE